MAVNRERGWRDSRDRRNEREANKSAGHDTHPKDGKPEVKEEEKNVWRHDRGRDRYGGKQGYHSSNGRVEKWKHDLFHEANRSPTLKNEENQIAKVEALLAS
ncbi:hypothetical protein HS088_TW17G00745 [Tripterygium wilfordii]|uniref:Uncharacterized protein n=1 Tax=Tripterygium wilfordii TaxID=458696 RepID=A0A7J7CGM3_TRIWF|nr:hypothetical protein HS088_TW17G00745 [Tripterygium wilfordii]